MCSATNIFLIDKLGLDCNDGSWLRRSYRWVVRHECTCSSIVFFRGELLIQISKLTSHMEEVPYAFAAMMIGSTAIATLVAWGGLRR